MSSGRGYQYVCYGLHANRDSRSLFAVYLSALHKVILRAIKCNGLLVLTDRLAYLLLIVFVLMPCQACLPSTSLRGIPGKYNCCHSNHIDHIVLTNYYRLSIFGDDYPVPDEDITFDVRVDTDQRLVC